MDLLPTGLVFGDQCEVQHQSNFLLRGLFLTYSFFFVNGFCVPFFLFASSLPVPLLHSSSFEFNEPKILISERTTHHGFYSSFKNYLGLCVRKGDEEKKPYVLFVFSPSHTISHSTPKGSRILKYADIESDKFSELIKKKFWVSERSDWKKFPFVFVHL